MEEQRNAESNVKEVSSERVLRFLEKVQALAELEKKKQNRVKKRAQI